jgi:hypothetical protein
MLDYESWLQRPANAQFLIDSGLLFEINRTILHLVGLALTVNKEGVISIKDSRSMPENLKLSKEVMVAAQKKWYEFTRNFAWKQMDRRANKLGWVVQPKVEE